MKKLALIFLISTTYVFATEASPSQASDMKFVTTFKNYACKSFRDQAQRPIELSELEMDFTKLGVSASTREIIIDLVSDNGECTFNIFYTRNKGEKILNYQSSTMSGPDYCHEKTEKLIPIFENGFKYVIKFNAYISLLFMTKVQNECLETSGNNLAEFLWEI